ncbi:MAG: YbhB/YbcL family Raf kinase inhibitor-like protein [Thermoprotei archaeon]|nr:MAG: YbhB/YbcL family Raf kinase inhibitor-like protein [Thermoprotei archaeon]HDJ83880.1 YbhB/YbcL family Raf kinase inhibitor-like protein [Desulfurococcaceae archaeon]
MALVLVIAIAYYSYTLSQQVKGDIFSQLIKEAEVEFTLLSPAFKNSSEIPVKYTCDGVDVSPPLKWLNAPKDAKSYVLIVFDPDAPRGIFIHWVMYNIHSEITELKENIPKKNIVEEGLQGINDFGYVGYGGPCPPKGSTHRYVFLLFALDKEIDLSGGAGLNDVINSMKGHIIGYAKLVGVYGR